MQWSWNNVHMKGLLSQHLTLSMQTSAWLGQDLGQGSMLMKGGSTLRPIFKTRRGVNVKARIQDKKECQFQSQDIKHGQVSMSRLISKTRMGLLKGVNISVKVKIQDRRKCQCQIQDPWQRWMLPMSQLRFGISRRSSNSIESTDTFCDQFSRWAVLSYLISNMV